MATQLRSAFKTKRHGALSTCSARLTAIDHTPAHCFNNIAILWTKNPDRDRDRVSVIDLRRFWEAA
jgi:hypothetical protein